MRRGPEPGLDASLGAFIQTGGRGSAEERAAEVASDTGRSGGRGLGEGGGALRLYA